MRVEKNFVKYQSEARAMRARYIGDLLSRGCDAVFRFFLSAVNSLTRTLITASRNPGSLAKR